MEISDKIIQETIHKTIRNGLDDVLYESEDLWNHLIDRIKASKDIQKTIDKEVAKVLPTTIKQLIEEVVAEAISDEVKQAVRKAMKANGS